MSYVMLSGFLVTVFLISYIWWPLLEAELSLLDPEIPLWIQIDWLLLGTFGVMTLLIMAKPDLKTDVLIILVGLAGGLVIESWGTQTEIWVYYTNERPPLWIIPAWPIASLAIDRLVRILCQRLPQGHDTVYSVIYWLVFTVFYGLMLVFVWPTLTKSLTIMALLLCALLIASPNDHRLAAITFLAGAGLGYFLERWGTTRRCWTYYTKQTPPLFAVLAHGMAAVAFWRTGVLVQQVLGRLQARPRRAERQVG